MSTGFHSPAVRYQGNDQNGVKIFSVDTTYRPYVRLHIIKLCFYHTKIIFSVFNVNCNTTDFT